jgi:glutamyl-tRNA reductase
LPFHVVGISHHTAGVDVRERFSLTSAEIGAMLERERAAGHSVVLLATCNRCELYWSGSHDLEGRFRELAQARGAYGAAPWTRLDGRAAVAHLMRVAAGLDSQIVGETEILGQVRRAFDLARAAGTTTRELDMVFSAALAAGRRVRSDTVIGRHAGSVSGAAVHLLRQLAGGSLGGRSLVLLGAGEAAEGVLQALDSDDLPVVTMVVRNPQRAQGLAHAWQVPHVRAWGELETVLARADVVIAATAAAGPIVSAAQLERAIGRFARELWVADLALPRNIDPESREVAGVHLYDLDDLRDRCCPAPRTGSLVLREADRILVQELDRLGATLRARAAAPALAELHRMGSRVVEEETARALDLLDGLSENERNVVRAMAERVARRLLYPVSRAVRAEGGSVQAGKEVEHAG